MSSYNIVVQMEANIATAAKVMAAETDAVIALVQTMSLEVDPLLVPQRLDNTHFFNASAVSRIPPAVSPEHE